LFLSCTFFPNHSSLWALLLNSSRLSSSLSISSVLLFCLFHCQYSSYHGISAYHEACG
jgi:hypothetical protein